MMILPEGLPERLVPLAWLAGSWQGFGTIIDIDIDDDKPALHVDASTRPSYVIFDVTYRLNDRHDALIETRRAFHAAMAGDGPALSISQSADEGLNLLQAGDLWWEERGEWLVERSQVATKTTPATAYVRVSSKGILTCAKGGSTEEKEHQAIWTAHVQGPRVTMSTIVADSIPLERIERNYGLVNGELMIVQDVYHGEETVSEWCIRMEKTGADV